MSDSRATNMYLNLVFKTKKAGMYQKQGSFAHNGHCTQWTLLKSISNVMQAKQIILKALFHINF